MVFWFVMSGPAFGQDSGMIRVEIRKTTTDEVLHFAYIRDEDAHFFAELTFRMLGNAAYLIQLPPSINHSQQKPRPGYIIPSTKKI
jgi:hypothetical protein